MDGIIKIFPTPLKLAESLADEIISLIRSNIGIPIPFTIALSGGNTPKILFGILGDHYADSVRWEKVHFFWVDERCVSPDNSESNFGMTQETFLAKIDIPDGNIHRIRGEDEPVKEALRYSSELEKFTIKNNGIPSFDIILLGMGADGHTASIFPGYERLFDTDSWCLPSVNPVTGQKRVTLTGKVINNGARIYFLVTGRSKAAVVKRIFENGDQEKQFPASYVSKEQGKVHWYLDGEAGSLIK